MPLLYQIFPNLLLYYILSCKQQNVLTEIYYAKLVGKIRCEQLNTILHVYIGMAKYPCIEIAQIGHRLIISQLILATIRPHSGGLG